MVEFTPTDEQESILSHRPTHHARVLAGPGTGKSATLVALVNQLLSEQDSLRVRLLTFTRAATGELAKKVSGHPAAVAERPSTIHSFAISVLLRNPGVGELPTPLRIADDWETGKIVYPTLAKRIGVPKRHLNDLFRELAANFESLTQEEIPRVDCADRARFMGGWQEHREIFGYTLLAELPYALMHGLQDHPDLEGVGCDLLVVDEYQDLNACDLKVLWLLAQRGCSIIGAGDDDQSIYSFRRAAPEGIRRFPDDYDGCGDYTLSVSHRCGSRIIEWATFVIEGDPDRPHGRPRLTSAEGSPPGEVALLAFKGDKSEAKGISHLVQRLVRDENVTPSEVLILLRSDYRGAFSKPIKEALDELAIPYSDPDEVKRVLAERSNRKILATLRLLIHRTDSLAWASLLNLQAGIGKTFVDYVYECARRESETFGESLLAGHEAGFPEAPKTSANRAKVLIQSTLKWVDENEPPETWDEGWGHWIIEAASSEGGFAPSQEFIQILSSLDALAETDRGLGRYLSQIAPLAKDLAQTQSQGVRIMTMAASKGLTVEATIVAGLEEGIIPRPDADLAEERRLLYVAMTRSRKFLFGTWARRRTGPTARSGKPKVRQRRNPTHFLRSGPVESQDGEKYI